MRRNPATTKGHLAFGRTRLFSVLALSLTLVACGDLYQTCGGAAPTDLKTHTGPEPAIVTGVQGVYAYRRTNQNRVFIIDDTTEVLPEELELEITLQYRFLTETTNNHWRSFLDLLLPSAIACSPHYVEPEIVSALSDANLTSSASMGSGLEPGQSLAPFFDIQATDTERNGSRQEQAQVPLDAFGSDGPVPAQLRYLVTVRPDNVGQLMPPSEQLHRFTFSVTLNGNETYSADSRPVRVLVP